MPIKPALWFAAPRPIIILNAAAYTAVDRAESERDLAFAINEQAPRILAEEALERNALLVHYSTDYVFDGSKPEPWVEADPPNPLNVYGASKLAGEQAVANIGGKYLIFRTSWVYGPHGNNFLLTMLRLARERDSLSIVDDQVGGPTTSIQLARATHAIVTGILAGRFGAAQDWAGLYHMTCGGSVSWFGFIPANLHPTRRATCLQMPSWSSVQRDYPTVLYSSDRGQRAGNNRQVFGGIRNRIYAVHGVGGLITVRQTLVCGPGMKALPCWMLPLVAYQLRLVTGVFYRVL